MVAALTIGQLAMRSGVGVETIRFYERKGIIAQPARPSNGYRKYDEQIADRIRFVQQAHELGFTLKEIKELLSLRVNPRMSCATVKERAEAKIVDVDAKIAALRRMKGALVKITRTCSGAGPTSECPILDYMEKKR